MKNRKEVTLLHINIDERRICVGMNRPMMPVQLPQLRNGPRRIMRGVVSSIDRTLAGPLTGNMVYEDYHNIAKAWSAYARSSEEGVRRIHFAIRSPAVHETLSCEP